MLQFLRKIIGEKSLIRFIYYCLKSFVAALIYGFPGKKIKVIGVTGTDGKTTTANLITHLLNQAQRKTGMISTTSFSVGEIKMMNLTKRTSVSPFLMNRLLRQMLKAKCEFVVLEVSSHALEQKRFFGVDFDVAVLTNITPEHLDYHKNMQEYRKVKAILFQKLSSTQKKNNQKKVMVLNQNDPVFEDFIKFQADQKYSYSFNQNSDFTASEIILKADATEFVLNFQAQKLKIILPLVGEFNVENALAASAVGIGIGLNLEQIKRGLENFPGVEGRMEKINAGQKFNVIVDFALTPEALRKLFTTVKKFTTGKVIVVMGCAGDRDREKRPVIGELGAKMVDVFILTDDETYTEDSAKIRDEIKVGIEKTAKIKGQDWYEIPERLEAIRFAFKMAKEDDTVLIPGMGSECTRNLGGIEIEWNEREIVRKELQRL